MTTTMSVRPQPTEYAPYYERYVSLVPDGPIVEVLRTQVADTLRLLRALPESRGEHRYAPGKWSVKELLGHVIDAERVFSYRALRFGRNDPTELPGFDENVYAPAGGFSARTLASLLDELETVRRATVFLFEGFPPEAWSRQGVASQNAVSVRGLAYIIAGHERHHRSILAERYLA